MYATFRASGPSIAVDDLRETLRTAPRTGQIILTLDIIGTEGKITETLTIDITAAETDALGVVLTAALDIDDLGLESEARALAACRDFVKNVAEATPPIRGKIADRARELVKTHGL